MDKIDLILSGIIIAVMIACFFLNSNWSYFCAGICATCLFVVNIGRIAHLADRNSKEKQWENFMDGLDTSHPVSAK